MADTLNTEMVTYSTATQLARSYADGTKRIRELLTELGDECTKLQAAFAYEHTFTSYFNVEARNGSDNYKCDSDGIDSLMMEMRRHAWAVLIEKLDIYKIMSSKRAAELKDVLHNRWRRGEAREQLPEITEETILSVLAGFVESAETYLQEKITEEFEFWRPGLNGHNRHKTNAQSDRVARKVIKGYMVRSSYSATTPFQPTYEREPHLIALDSVFHALDGKGPLKEHKGQLASAIIRSVDGAGETDYFAFRCFQNGNLHLTFRRDDLLAKFNRIGSAGSNRVGKQREPSRS
jgi:hypothetical protein